jgi:hypothetical protein
MSVLEPTQQSPGDVLVRRRRAAFAGQREGIVRRHRRWIIGSGTLVAALALVGLCSWLNRGRTYDPRFDTRVAEPTYEEDRPRVLYDEGHRNTHTADEAYKPFADLVRSDGYRLQVNRAPISEGMLAGISVLVVVCARGANDANDSSAFSEPEVSVIDHWVRTGGSLLLITDHWPYGSAVESLARGFGVHMGCGLVEDRDHSDSSLANSHLVFSRENGLLVDHPIVRGRNARERIQKVLTFTGQSLLGPLEAVAFMSLSEGAIERAPSTPRVQKDGGDVRVTMEYGDPVSARGRAQGIAFELDRGRIVILGDAGMLRAQRESDGSMIGMNHPGYDNRQLALNIMHWLSHAL